MFVTALATMIVRPAMATAGALTDETTRSGSTTVSVPVDSSESFLGLASAATPSALTRTR